MSASTLARTETAPSRPVRDVWQRLSAGTGAKGLRYFHWAFISLPHAVDAHGGHIGC